MTRSESGSVFVESIIAAAIVAMALGSTLQVIADSAARERKSDARRGALLVAQSAMASVGADIPIAPGDVSGVSGDLAWRVTIEPYPVGGEPNAAGALLSVRVAVAPRAGGPDLVSLDTLRLGGKA